MTQTVPPAFARPWGWNREAPVPPPMGLRAVRHNRGVAVLDLVLPALRPGEVPARPVEGGKALTIVEIEAVRDAITYDDGQNVRVEGMAPCPWCGPQEGHLMPFVQVGPEWAGGMIDSRVVCGCCHVATSHESCQRLTRTDTGEDVTRLAAIAMSVKKWNDRKGK